MKNVSEIFRAGQVLTLEVAKNLKGKKIATTHPVYKANKATVTEFVVGEIISEWDLAATKVDPKNFPQGNQQLYWASYMSEDRINDQKNKLVLLAEDGTNHYIYCFLNSGYFDEPTFTCSDEDREVYYVEVVTAKKSVMMEDTDVPAIIEGNTYMVVPENQIWDPNQLRFAKEEGSIVVIDENGKQHFFKPENFINA